jgi:hypothetical protein
MTVQMLRELLTVVEDPHEFATAYVNHVESTTTPLDVTAAVQRFVTTGRI